jgi:hypothetical protein
MTDNADHLAELLSEGLDLCARARRLEAQDRTNTSVSASKDGEQWERSGQLAKYAKMHNETWPDTPMMTRSATIPLWVQEQYETDLADWEKRSRAAMIRLGYGR